MDTIGFWELLMIVLAVGLLFGADRLPQLARSLGEGIRAFRHALHEESRLSNPTATQQHHCDPGAQRRRPA